MPDVAKLLTRLGLRSRRKIEACKHSRDVSRICLDRVFPGGALVGFWRHGYTSKNDLTSLHIVLDVKCLAIQYLKLDQVNVHGMHIASRIRERPEFHRTGLRIFG